MNLAPPLIFLTTFALGCVPLQPADPDPRDLYSPLLAADLASFQHQINLDHHRGLADAWTDLATAYLALAACDPVSEASPALTSTPRAHLLHHLVALEDHRRQRLIAAARHLDQQPWHQNTIHTQFTSRTFFQREPGRLADDLIHWPPSTDFWQDEWPAPTEVAYHCDSLGDRVEDDPAGLLVGEWQTSGEALQLLDHPSIHEDLSRRVRLTLLLHRGDLAIALLDFHESHNQPENAHAIAHQALDDLLNEASFDDPADPAEPAFARALRITSLARSLDDPDAAVDALTILLQHPNDRVADTARYLLVQTAWTQGWWETASEHARIPLARTSPLHSAHAYFGATSHLYAGHDDAFLGLARHSLQDRRRDTHDPFSGALLREVLRFLARFDVDERTEEILEELGPRSQLAQRKQELARVALDLGRPEVARDLIEPLLATTDDARRLPALQAILALAAFLQDDRAAFNDYIAAIAARPEWARELIPRGRRATFFAHQDAELARVLRAMLPLMAEWGDDDSSRALRQRWLTAVVEQTQRFLRWAPESSVSESLSELYRLASQLLEDHPRGYAQRVGSEHPSSSALILGTVELSTAPPIHLAPAPRLRWAPLNSLLLIPTNTTKAATFVSTITPPDQADADGEERQ